MDDLDYVVLVFSGLEVELSGEVIYGVRIGEGMIIDEMYKFFFFFYKEVDICLCVKRKGCKC